MRENATGPAAGAGDAQAILAIGIDNLAVLEELFGDAIGAEVAAAVARRLDAVLPSGARLRMTRHRRFLVRVAGLDAADAAALFARLQDSAAARAIETGRGPVAVTLSGGCAFTGNRQSADAPDLAEAAGLHALHGAMARSVGAFETARDDGALLRDRARLVAASRAAVGPAGADRLAIAFQPVVRATGGHTISFHECLVRMRQPDGSLLAAAGFMPAIERLGLAPLIDRRVLQLTFATLARHPTARLSINIFPQTMQDRHWMALFEEAVARDPALADRLIVELTETCSVLDPGRTQAFMDRLRGHGVAFALDDFGAGHTSLHYLRDFRFDIIKIDGRFVRGVRPGSDNAFFARKIVEIARRFDIMTVAETVQDPAEARCLADLGVEFFQGFHFGCPNLVLEPTPSPMPGVAAQA